MFKNKRSSAAPLADSSMRPQAGRTRLTLLGIVAAICLLLSSNILVGALTDRFGLRLDLTSEQLYTLSDETVRTLDALDSPVTLKVFCTETDALPLLSETLARYVLAGHNLITTQYIDPYTHPEEAKVYTARGYTIAESTIAVQGERYERVIQLADLFETDESGAVIALKTEQLLTPAILFASKADPRPMQFIEGHDEAYSESLKALFVQNNYAVGRVTLSVNDPEAELLVLADPQRDLEPQEVFKLDAFMAEGGSLIVFLSPNSSALPCLCAFLSEWGIGVTDTQVAEKLQYVDANPLSIIPVYASHRINSYFVRTRIYPVMTGSVALEQLFTRSGLVSTSKVLYSTDKAYASGGTALQSPYVLAIASEKTLGQHKARLLAVGSSGIYADSLMKTPSYANADFIAQAAAWANEEELAVSIAPRDVRRIPLAVTNGQIIAITAGAVVILPLLLLLLGTIVWLRRRHL